MAIAILGRPNVGKSSLLNALVGRPKSLVWNQEGVTRDRVKADWVARDGELRELWDFAGWDLRSISDFRSFPVPAWKSQIDLILFVIDGTSELTALDQELSREIRKLNRPVIVVCNKSDRRTFSKENLEAQASLGAWPIVSVSAEKKEGLLDLEDELLKVLGKKKRAEKASKKKTEKVKNDRLLILGRPNVGKSSLMNRLAGTEVSFVSEKAGTTRDLVEFDRKIEKKTWTFLDSAGVRKKAKIYGRAAEAIEIFSVHKALRELKTVDFCLLLVEPHPKALFHTQDKKLLRLVAESQVPCIVAVNKWDQIRDRYKAKSYVENLRSDMASFAYLPVVLVSAHTGFQVKKLLKMIDQMDRSFRKIKTSELNQWLVRVQSEKQPLLARRGQFTTGKRTANQYLKYFYMVQTSEKPLRFQIFCNAPQAVAKEEKRFLARRLREDLGLGGLPIEFAFRKKVSSRSF